MQKSISIVIPFHNESQNVEALYETLTTLMDHHEQYRWEVVCVNDGSHDDSLLKFIDCHRKDSRFKIIDLSRNFGKEAALSAGLQFAKGDVVIPFDADLQDPADVIPKLIEKWEEGYDIVNAVRETREGETWLKKTTAHYFYLSINKISKVKIAENTGDFRLLSRSVVDELNKLPERRRFMKGLFSWVGFKTTSITYQRAARHAGNTKWNYWRLWNFALEGITSFSQLPLQLFAYFGAFVAFLSFLYGIFIIIKTLIFGNPVAGYPSIMTSIMFMGGVQLIALGIIGEYLGRVYDEVKQRPIYIVRQTWM